MEPTTELKAYAQAQLHGMRIIRSASGLVVQELVEWGLSLQEATEILQLHATYYGRTSNSRKQKNSRASTHTLSSLKKIEYYAKQVRDHNMSWDLRQELCLLPAELIDSRARQRLAQWRTPLHRTPGIQRQLHANGLATLRITAPTAAIQDVYGNIREASDQVAAFLAHFFSGGASRTQLTTNVIIPLEAGMKMVGNDAFDVCLEMTNGATITGRDFLNAKFAEVGWATLVEPSGMPIYAGRTRRLANEVQRAMASAQNTSCAWDDLCRRPADECEVHHIRAFKHGGTTDPPNLAMLCAFHNGRNDDSPDAPPVNGRIERINGIPVRVFKPPRGSPHSLSMGPA